MKIEYRICGVVKYGRSSSSQCFAPIKTDYCQYLHSCGSSLSGYYFFERAGEDLVSIKLATDELSPAVKMASIGDHIRLYFTPFALATTALCLGGAMIGGIVGLTQFNSVGQGAMIGIGLGLLVAAFITIAARSSERISAISPEKYHAILDGLYSDLCAGQADKVVALLCSQDPTLDDLSQNLRVPILLAGISRLDPNIYSHLELLVRVVSFADTCSHVATAHLLILRVFEVLQSHMDSLEISESLGRALLTIGSQCWPKDNNRQVFQYYLGELFQFAVKSNDILSPLRIAVLKYIVEHANGTVLGANANEALIGLYSRGLVANRGSRVSER